MKSGVGQRGEGSLRRQREGTFVRFGTGGRRKGVDFDHCALTPQDTGERKRREGGGVWVRRGGPTHDHISLHRSLLLQGRGGGKGN